MRILSFITLSLLLFSCGQTPSSPPRDLIAKNTLEKVLLDINIAETYSAMVKDTLRRPGSKNPDSLSAYYKEIFGHYKITPEQFTKSLDWYKTHPDELDTMYNNIIPVAARWQAKPLASTIKPPAPAKDTAHPSNVDTAHKH